MIRSSSIQILALALLISGVASANPFYLGRFSGLRVVRSIRGLFLFIGIQVIWLCLDLGLNFTLWASFGMRPMTEMPKPMMFPTNLRLSILEKMSQRPWRRTLIGAAFWRSMERLDLWVWLDWVC